MMTDMSKARNIFFSSLCFFVKKRRNKQTKNIFQFCYLTITATPTGAEPGMSLITFILQGLLGSASGSHFLFLSQQSGSWLVVECNSPRSPLLLHFHFLPTRTCAILPSFRDIFRHETSEGFNLKLILDIIVFFFCLF